MKKELSFVYGTITNRRTIRRFKQKPVAISILKKLVNAARLAPSAANLQALEFIIVNKKSLLGEIFKHLRWAAYIAPVGNPPKDKQPTACVIVLINKNIANEKYFAYDIGAAVENLILAAWENKIGCCWIKSIDCDSVVKILNVPLGFFLDSVVALGYCGESPKAVTAKDSIKYYKDKKGVLCVPKRALNSILHYNKF